jgi:hypothetical protein
MSALNTKPGKTSRQRPDLAIPDNAVDLVQLAIKAGDPYSAAAVYEVATGDDRKRLESLMFGERRNALMLARWEHTPASVLQGLSGLGDFAVRVKLDKNPGTTGPILSKLYRGERHAALIGLIAQHRHTPEEVLDQIAEMDEDLNILKAVCANPAASERVIRTIAARLPGTFDSEIATHPATPADMLEAIYPGSNDFVRAAIVSHASCPQRVLDEAANEKAVAIRRHLAANERIGEEFLERLAHSPDATVRRAAAANPALDVVSVQHLMRDEAISVRRAVAARGNLPPAAIECLAGDPDHWVRQRIARHPATPARLLKRLAQEDNVDVRRAVARNPACPRALLKKLAGDVNAWVRSAVAYQPNTTVVVLKMLAEDENLDVLSGVAANPRTPQSILRRLAQSAEADVRRGVILNPCARRKTLRPLLQDPYYLHRLLLTGNAVLHGKDKWTLHDDPDPSVRFSAMRWFAGKFLHTGRI